MSGESRRAERRIGDRRASRRASATEGSWFGELSGSADLPPDDAAGADDTVFLVKDPLSAFAPDVKTWIESEIGFSQ